MGQREELVVLHVLDDQIGDGGLQRKGLRHGRPLLLQRDAAALRVGELAAHDGTGLHQDARLAHLHAPARRVPARVPIEKNPFQCSFLL